MNEISSMQVLVIDDYENQYIFIKDILSTVEHIHFQVDWASTFEAGQAGIKSGAYDVALVDYDLGDRNGIDLVRYAVTRNYATPLIVLTGRGSRDVDLEAMRAGASDYLDKSNLRLAMLERSIRYAVERAKTLNALRESEGRQRVLMQTVPAGVFILQDDHTEYVNHTFTRMTGLTAEQLNEVGLEAVLTYVDASHREELRKRLMMEVSQDTIANFEFMARVPQRGDIWVNMATSILILDGRPAMLGTLTDITRRVQAEKAEHQQRVFAEALLDISVTLNRTLDFNRVLKQILHNVGRVVPHDIANIMLIDGGHARIVAHSGYERSEPLMALPMVQYTIAEAPALQIMYQSGEAFLINDLQNSPDRIPVEGTENLRSYIGVPILSGGQVIGFLNLDSYNPAFYTHFHADRLKVFAELAAIAIRNARTFENAQTKAAQEERQRLARDLHDAVSQTLFSANMIAETLPRLLDRSTEDAKQGLERLARLTRGALAEMRTLLLELRPATFEKTDLRTLLYQLASAFESRTQISVRFDGEAEPNVVPDVKIVFYRIAQEALNNVMKHARASHVTIHLEDNLKASHMAIVDDGRGFDMSQVAPERMGLNIMRERAESIDAELEIFSSIGEGTQVVLQWERK